MKTIKQIAQATQQFLDSNVLGKSIYWLAAMIFFCLMTLAFSFFVVFPVNPLGAKWLICSNVAFTIIWIRFLDVTRGDKWVETGRIIPES